MDSKKLNAIIGYVSRSLAAAALMIWGVFNISLFLFQRQGDPASSGDNFLTGALLCFAFGGIPLLIGTWLLYRNVASVTKK